MLRCRSRPLSIASLSLAAFTAPPSDTVAVEGGQALFDCAFTSFNPVSIIWRHNGSVATPSDKFTYLANNSLLIDPIQSGDQGEYTCVVTDLVSNAVEERSASLTFACESTLLHAAGQEDVQLCDLTILFSIKQ